MTEGDYVEPKTVYEAKQSDDWDQWHRAMKDEVKALQDNETWNLVRPPTDRDVIPGNVIWVYKVKLGPSGQVDKYKARYLAKGFKQVDWTTLRLLRLPVSQRHSGFYFSYERSRAM